MDIDKSLELAGVPKEHTDAIKANLATSKKLFSKVTPYKFTSFIVMLFICPFLKWEYNTLVEVLERQPFKWLYKKWPGLYDFIDRYDNNISMNGDGLDWTVDPINGRMYEGVPYSRVPLDLNDTPEARKKNYYAFGLHGRSNIARYVWLGLRNKASKYALDLGPAMERVTPVVSFVWKDDKGNIVEVFTKEGYWQIKTVKVVGPFLFRQNFGFKINNFMIDLQDKCMVTYKTFDLVRNN